MSITGIIMAAVIVGGTGFADAATGAAGYTPITIFILAPGAFLVLAGLAAIQNKVKINMAKKGKDVSKIQSGCGSNCATCGGCPSDKE